MKKQRKEEIPGSGGFQNAYPIFFIILRKFIPTISNFSQHAAFHLTKCAMSASTNVIFSTTHHNHLPLIFVNHASNPLLLILTTRTLPPPLSYACLSHHNWPRKISTSCILDIHIIDMGWTIDYYWRQTLLQSPAIAVKFLK